MKGTPKLSLEIVSYIEANLITNIWLKITVSPLWVYKGITDLVVDHFKKLMMTILNCSWLKFFVLAEFENYGLFTITYTVVV